MHRSTGLVDTSSPHAPLPPTISMQIPPALMDLQIVPPVQLEFKELVSQKCSERGIIFAPMPGRRESGKQVSFIFCLCLHTQSFNIILNFRYIVSESCFATLTVRWWWSATAACPIGVQFPYSTCSIEPSLVICFKVDSTCLVICRRQFRLANSSAEDGLASS